MKNDVLKVLNIALLSQIVKKLDGLKIESNDEDIEIVTMSVGIAPSHGNYIECSPVGVELLEENEKHAVRVIIHTLCSEWYRDIILCDDNFFIRDGSLIYFDSEITTKRVFAPASGDNIIEAYSLRNDDDIDALIRTEQALLFTSLSRRWQLVTLPKPKNYYLLPFGYFTFDDKIYRVDMTNPVLPQEVSLSDSFKKTLFAENTGVLLYYESNTESLAVYSNKYNKIWGYIHSRTGNKEINGHIINIRPNGDDLYITTTDGFYKISNGKITRYVFELKGEVVDSKDCLIWDINNIIREHDILSVVI